MFGNFQWPTNKAVILVKKKKKSFQTQNTKITQMYVLVKCV